MKHFLLQLFYFASKKIFLDYQLWVSFSSNITSKTLKCCHLQINLEEFHHKLKWLL